MRGIKRGEEAIAKLKNKFKDFFSKSKKLVEPPKELPDITRPATPLPAQTPKEPAAKEVPKTPKKEFKLPWIKYPKKQETIQPVRDESVKTHEEDLKQFEEAINNINIDMVHSESPASAPATKESAEYYKPVEIGEGYFSEIEHYVRHKDVNEIIDDVLKKDFLTSMKDYHNTKAEGKPFYLHKKDLKYKLDKKMNQLRKLEEEWHSLKSGIEEKEKKKKEIENRIDQESQELKKLFRQVKINQVLEKEAPKEHYFKLSSGQELKSLNDLRKALEYMTEEEFNHHATKEKNDFANWVKEALQNQELYEKIKQVKSKEELQEILKNPF